MRRGVNALLRERVRVRGAVQGVGFRPFVYRLATELALDGWVLNDAEGVEIEVQGERARVAQFVERLGREAPPLARVEAIERQGRAAERCAEGFAIALSRDGRARTAVCADAAVCEDCLEDLFDRRGRRFLYPFVNCTHCGPRYTITRALPYDRPQTTMAPFAQCPECLREYGDPADRRFHAQPNACPACGPRLVLEDRHGEPLEGDPVTAALRLIRDGGIVALKGLGGFHLACDAGNRAAVARLRRAKGREEKPFAVMFANVESIHPYARVGAAAASLLRSRERPIVLLDKTPPCDGWLEGVAPGVGHLGVLLPYTPLHYLLFFAASGERGGTEWLRRPQPLALVMTSANPGGEPLVVGNREALARLEGIADAFLVHDRDIAARCDDSVVRPGAHGPVFIRRARGYTPRGIRLPRSAPAVLACGAWLKNTICLTREDQAFLSPHIGDLDNGASCAALDEAAAHLAALLEVEPAIVAHDLHPDFYSTRFAAAFALARGLPRVAVQHHHAHIAAVCAEHGVDSPVLGLALDGVGLGTDGRAWGGELLRVEGATFRRLGHLRELPLAGGDRAAREPWRMAAAALHLMGREAEIAQRFDRPLACLVARLLAGGRCAPTSSAGRWFDAAAALLGVREVCGFEGQAAMELEALAERHGASDALRAGYSISGDGVLDLLPLAQALAGERDAARGAALFHDTLAAALAEWAVAAAAREGVWLVALGGGCFMNRRLARVLARELRAHGLEVLEAAEAPANDGGVALGQAWVAMRQEAGHVPRDTGADR